MRKRRKITIYNEDSLRINQKAFKKFIYYYYKGPFNIEIRADSRLQGWGQHIFEGDTHYIKINPKHCSYNKNWEQWSYSERTVTGGIVKMNRHDQLCRTIHTVLHELRHAHQCDKLGVNLYDNTVAQHPEITQRNLKVELSELEGDAEGWALLNFNKALNKYKQWVKEYSKTGYTYKYEERF